MKVEGHQEAIERFKGEPPASKVREQAAFFDGMAHALKLASDHIKEGIEKA